MATTTPSREAESTDSGDRSGTETRAVDIERLAAAVDSTGRFALAGRIASAPLRRGWLDVTITDRRNVPADGPVILAANHHAFIDSLLVMYSLERRVIFLGKSEYLTHPIAGRLFPATGMLPLDRSGRAARITLDRVNEILGSGGIVGVHPEGTRSRDGLLGPGHPGVAQMALRAGVPVVPVALIGTDTAQPVGRRVPHFRAPIEIRFGAPIDTGPWAEARRSARSRAEFTEEIMASIAALSGQERRPTVEQAVTEPAVP